MKIIPGQRFGRLRAVEYVPGSRWRCVCDCGAVVVIKTDSLNAGKTKSCGCLRVDRARSRATKHGGADEPLYHVLNAMHQRCENPKAKDYKWYGAEGVTVCSEWGLKNYSIFKAWAEKTGYKAGLTIDRIDPKGPYSPQNCRWVSIQEQQGNKRNTRRRHE